LKGVGFGGVRNPSFHDPAAARRPASIRNRAASGQAELIASKPTKVAAVALANKLARITWALLRDRGTYKKPAVVAAA
jgi:hypothetical protein